MKNLIKSKIFWFFVVVTAAIGTYFGFKNNWWMEIPVEESKVETIETPVVETDSMKIIEVIIVDTNPYDSAAELGGISYILSVEK